MGSRCGQRGWATPFPSPVPFTKGTAAILFMEICARCLPKPSDSPGLCLELQIGTLPRPGPLFSEPGLLRRELPSISTHGFLEVPRRRDATRGSCGQIPLRNSPLPSCWICRALNVCCTSDPIPRSLAGSVVVPDRTRPGALWQSFSRSSGRPEPPWGRSI